MFNKAKKFVKRNKKKFAVPVGMAVMSISTAASAFAADGDVVESGSSGAYQITSQALAPLTTSINTSLTELIPVGITLLATMIGISLIRRVVYSFI